MNARIILASLFLVSACSSTPGAKPHDMSEAEHEATAKQLEEAAEAHESEYDPTARAERRRCPRVLVRPQDGPTSPVCWTSVSNPTKEHLRAAEKRRKQAEDHRAASASLREAEARACAGINAEDRDTSPFERVEDISGAEPWMELTGTSNFQTRRLVGAVVTFRAVPGLTEEWFQRMVDCHVVRNAALGHDRPDMPTCPLVLKGVEARVSSTKDGFKVSLRADDTKTAEEIWSRARQLQKEEGVARKEK